MSMATHRIRQATVEVSADGVDAFRWQREVASWAQDCLMPMLEEAFAGLPETEALIRINRLEIAVAANDLARWGDTALSQIRAEVSNQLHAHGLAAQRRMQTGYDHAWAESGLSDDQAILDPVLAFATDFSRYLVRGALPWNLHASTGAELIEQIEKTVAGLEGRSASLTHRFGLEFARAWKYPAARQRFLALPQPLILRILHRLFGFEPALASAWLRDASRLVQETSLKGDLGDEILSALARHPRLFEHGLGDEIVDTYLLRLIQSGKITRSRDTLLIPSNAMASLESEAFQRATEGLLHRVSSIPESGSGSRPGSEASAHAPGRPSALTTASDPRQTELSVDLAGEKNQTREYAKSGQDGHYIEHAGLVLGAPFLTTLFERLGLWSQTGSTLTDPPLALSLLHYLVTGKGNAFEFQLPLAKVLCGLPIESAFDLPPTLPASHRDEADALLQSLLNHWGALKDTSIDGLREAFLQRPGKLSRRDDDWLLQVEQRPFDMLLQQLPWSLQFIRLPWMPKFLRTEWME